MFPCLRSKETFVAEGFFVSERQKLFLIPFARRGIMLTGSVVAYAVFPKLSMPKRLFSVKWSWFPWQGNVVSRTFAHACFRGNSSFAGAFIITEHKGSLDIEQTITESQTHLHGLTRRTRTAKITWGASWLCQDFSAWDMAWPIRTAPKGTLHWNT